MASGPVDHGGAKTYWHLQSQRRIPSDYEIASTRLLYYPTLGFSVDTPGAAWMSAHAADVDLKCGDWEAFTDPAAMTYRDYVEARRDREVVVAEALRLEREAAPLSDRKWCTTRARVLAPMRYPWHGLQMVSAYLAHLAPGSRIAIAGLFQTADLLRCVDALTRRIDALQESDPARRGDARAAWEDDAMWQPARRAIERLLTAYRWSECFAALNLVVKPILDEWLLHHLGDLARRAGDEATRLILWSLHEDTLWHRAWSAELAARLCADADNRRTLTGAVAHWREEMQPVEAAFAPLYDDAPARRAQSEKSLREFWSAAGIETELK